MVKIRQQRLRASRPVSRPRQAISLARAQEHYERAIKAQRDGNWALYGEEIERLGEIIGKMR